MVPQNTESSSRNNCKVAACLPEKCRCFWKGYIVEYLSGLYDRIQDIWNMYNIMRNSIFTIYFIFILNVITTLFNIPEIL